MTPVRPQVLLGQISRESLEQLLSDKSTKGRLRWATAEYTQLGPGYAFDDEMSPNTVIPAGGSPVVTPRSSKPRTLQVIRTQSTAEVFTPAWVCCEQNNGVDEAWFGRPGALCGKATEDEGWTVSKEKVVFENGRTWQDYVDARVMEVSCGEGPYLTSRYDPCDGTPIPFGDRMGLFDRKLRVVNENAQTPDDWLKWALRALEATYGFDLQGDNVLITRVNLLATYQDHLEHRLGRCASRRELTAASNRIAWNIFQMDGFTFLSPHAERAAATLPLDLGMGLTFDKTEPVPCLIYDWRRRRPVEFRHLVRRA